MNGRAREITVIVWVIFAALRDRQVAATRDSKADSAAKIVIHSNSAPPIVKENNSPFVRNDTGYDGSPSPLLNRVHRAAGSQEARVHKSEMTNRRAKRFKMRSGCPIGACDSNLSF